MKETLSQFVQRIARLRGLPGPIASTSQEGWASEVRPTIARNIFGLHSTVLGAPSLGVTKSCYLPLKTDSSGYDQILIMLAMGERFERHMFSLLESGALTSWLRVPGTSGSQAGLLGHPSSDARLNVWSHDVMPRGGSHVRLEDLDRRDANYRQVFPRGGAIHWLERRDVERRGQFNPVAALNVEGLLLEMLSEVSITARAEHVTKQISNYVHCANQELRVYGFATPNDDIAAELGAELKREAVEDTDVDFDRVTLFIEPIASSDWLGRASKIRHRFALDII